MKSKNIYKEYNSGLKISSIKEALISIDKLKNMEDKAKARKLAKVMSLRALGNRTQDKEKQKVFKIVSAMYLKQSKIFQNGGLSDIKNKIFSNPVLENLLNKDNYNRERALNNKK